MGDTLDWWMQGGDWYDRKQQRAIQDLERSNAHARSRTRSLQKQVEKNQASLTKRVDRLERALRAVVELEDVREELNEHVPAALVRRHARSVVMAASGLTSIGSAGSLPEPPADVPGYWLAPAARWAASLGQSGADRSSLAEASRRDPVRTDLFVVALAAVSDQLVDASAALDRLQASPLGVTDWQREIWVAVAQHRFGDAARQSLIEQLRDVGADVTREQLSFALITASSIASPVESGRRLATLAQRVDSSASSPVPSPPVEGDDEASADEEVVIDRNDRLAELLAVIVDEGAPGEVAVLDSMVDIRRVLADDAAVQPPTRRVVDDVVGEPLALLLADLADAGSDVSDVAIEVFGSDVRGLANELHSTASSGVTPSALVDVFGQSVEVTSAGVNESEWIGRLHAAHPIEATPSVSPTGIVAVLVLVFGLLLVPLAGPIGFVVALAGAAGAGWIAWSYWQQRESAQRSTARREAARRGSARQIEEATKRVATETTTFESVMATIDESRERIERRVIRQAEPSSR